VSDEEQRRRAPGRASELEDGRHALAVARTQRRRLHGPGAIARTLGLVVACGLATAIPLWLVSRGVVTERSLDWIMPTSLLGTFFIGMVLILVWQGSTPTVAREPSSVRQGTSTAAELEREIRRVRLARLGEARLLATQMRGSAGSLDIIIGAALLVPVMGAAAWFSIQVVRGREPYEPLILVLWLASAAGLALIVGLRLRRRRRRRRLRQALDHAGESFAAHRLASHDHVVAWLNAVWAAPSAYEDLYEGPCHVAVAGDLRGYPVLIDIEPDGYTGEDVDLPPRVLVHIAARVCMQPPSSPVWREHHAALARAGFELALAPEAGLLARGLPELLTRMRRHPEALSELGSVVQRLVGLAEACGAPPAAREPEPFALCRWRSTSVQNPGASF
jgi:hypothetical protein